MLQTTLFGRPNTELRHIPNLFKRSNEELNFWAIVLQSQQQLSLEKFAQRLWQADKLGDVDYFDEFVLPHGTIQIAAEWDGGYRHNDDRIENDIRKTMKILRENPGMYVVRIRVGAPPIPELQNVDRCIIVQVPAGTFPVDAMLPFANAIRPLISGHDIFPAIPTSSERASVEVTNLRCVCNNAFAKAFARLKVLLGEKLAFKFVKVKYGVRGNLGKVVDGMERFKQEWKMGPDKLFRITCDSVIAAISRDAFWTNLATLITVCGIETSEQLCKIMCNSVASALGRDNIDAFWENLAKLKAVCKIETRDQWCKIMCDGVASALAGDKANSWLENLATFQTICAIEECDQWCKIMCDGVASALGADKAKYFWLNLAKIESVCDIKTCDQWCKIICGNSVASALAGDKPEFWTNLTKLKLLCDIKTCDQWCKIMCDSIAAAFCGDQADVLLANLAKLQLECDIKTICNSVASVLSGDKADVFIRGVERLRDVAISLGEANYDLSSFIGNTMASAIKNGKIDDIVAFVQLVGSIRKSQSYIVKESLLGILPDFFKLQDDQARELLASDRNKRRAIVKDIKAQKRQRI